LDLREIEARVEFKDVRFSSMEVFCPYTERRWERRESTDYPFATNSFTSDVRFPQISSI
jgi:hypothetical protein